MKRSLLAALAISAALPISSASAQSAVAAGEWSNDSALTVPAGRVEFGLFHPIHWGATDDIELSAHPLLALVLPHVEAKVRWVQRGPAAIATRHRLSYLSPFLKLISREGAGGLLPANTRVPFALGIDTAWLATWSFEDALHMTLELGFTVMPRTGHGDAIVLDFPFLYSRFGALSTDGTTFAGLSGMGAFSQIFDWQSDIRLTLVPVVPGGFVLEQGMSLTWHPHRAVGLSIGYRLAHGRYPVGLRTHFLPTFDALLGF